MQRRHMWQPSSASFGQHRGNGFCRVRNPGSQPNGAQGQPCYWRYGEGPHLCLHIWIIKKKNKAEPHLQLTRSCVWRGVYFSSKGSIILDPDFQEMGHLCQMCRAIGANRQLVKPGGAQCLPSGNILASRIMVFKTQYLVLHSVCIWYIHIHHCLVLSVYFFLF